MAKRGLISIHAPPRGATENPFVAVEADLFQFTPLREGRRCHLRGFANMMYFNSRPSARGDSLPHHVRRAGHISIHAPPRGATSPSMMRSRALRFQFTPLREGRRRRPSSRRSCRMHFNSRPSARGDQPRNRQARCSAHFNSRPSARGDRRCRPDAPEPAYFNSRPSARGDGSFR